MQAIGALHCEPLRESPHEQRSSTRTAQEGRRPRHRLPRTLPAAPKKTSASTPPQTTLDVPSSAQRAPAAPVSGVRPSVPALPTPPPSMPPSSAEIEDLEPIFLKGIAGSPGVAVGPALVLGDIRASYVRRHIHTAQIEARSRACSKPSNRPKRASRGELAHERAGA